MYSKGTVQKAKASKRVVKMWLELMNLLEQLSLLWPPRYLMCIICVTNHVTILYCISGLQGADIDVPAGTMRMHRYRGITAFLAADEGMNNIDTPSSSISSASAAAGAGLSPMDRNGTVYVALSVDDQV